MFTLKYSQLAGSFSPTLQKLCRMPLPTKTAYQVKKMTDVIQRELKKMRAAFTKDVVEVYAKKDAEGKFALDSNGDFQIDETKQAEFDEAQKAFGERTFEVERDKLNLAWFENINITAAELAALDPILQDPEEAPEAPVVALRK